MAGPEPVSVEQRAPMTHAASPDSCTILPAQPSDTREVAELWCHAFPGRRTIEDRIAMLEGGGRYGGLETVLVMRDAAGSLAGASKIYRMESRIAGAALPMMGLAAVAVAPSYRRRGLGARLCLEAMDVARQRGDVLSVLYPFRPDYYQRLGWGLVGELHDYRFETAALPRYEEARHVRPAEGESDGEEIAACYARVAARSNGPITRDRRVWAYRLAGQELGVRPLTPDAARATPRADARVRAVVFDDHGVTGYALLRGLSRRAGGERSLEIRELLAESERAYRGLLGHVATLSDRWPRARHFARPEERFGDRLRDPRPPGRPTARSLYFPTARIVRGPMLRVLDVAAALRARPWFDAGGARAGSVSIRVHDAQRPENEGPWLVRLNGAGGGVVEAGVEAGLGGRRETGDPDIELSTDASTFGRIFAGDISASEAARIGRAAIEGDASLIDGAFATSERFWLLDEF